MRYFLISSMKILKVLKYLCMCMEPKNGSVVIQIGNNEEREKIKQTMQKKMGEDYEINVPNQLTENGRNKVI